MVRRVAVAAALALGRVRVPLMTSEALRRLARVRLEDYDRRASDPSVRDGLALSPSEAYALQGEVARLREQRGEKVIGFKVGCTSRAIQQQLGMDGPIFGRLFATECHPSGACLSHARYANLAVEGELAVRLSRDLDFRPTLSREECLAVIGSIFPVIELHHYVLADGRAPGPELIASNGMNAGFVRAEGEPVRPGRLDSVRKLTIRINEALADSVDGSGDVDPAGSIQWLAARLAGLGLRLTEGQVILTGSPMRLFPVAPGDRVVVDAMPLGTSRAEIAP